MFYISEIKNAAPNEFKTVLQKKVYQTLEHLNIAYERVDTDEAITMADCCQIDQTLKMKMVKTLFLCNRQQTDFYLFISGGEKLFRAKDFCKALAIPRVSFAPAGLMEGMLGTKIGAATIFSTILDTERKVRIVFDRDVMKEEWYGCSDGTTTGYMKIKTDSIITDFLGYTGHLPAVIEV